MVIQQIAAAIAGDKTSPAHVAASFRRLFRIRLALGMLDPPTSVQANTLVYNTTELGSNAAHLQVCMQALITRVL